MALSKRRRNRRKTRKGGMTGLEIGIAVALAAGIAGAAYAYRPSSSSTEVVERSTTDN
jgi:type II secretory pathway pseudopilin PulG